MKKIIVLISLLFSSNLIFSQFAIINDKDGFTNVRKEPNQKSEIIYKLSDSEVFFYSESKSDINWIAIQIPKNKFHLGVNSGSEYLNGFIHKSRLLEVGKLTKHTGKEFKIKYIIDDFNPDTKVIDYIDNTKIVKRINGRDYYGSDGGIPKTEIKDIKVTVKDININMPPVFFQDIFESNNKFTIYKNKEDFIVEQWNSDGAGGYLLIWVFGKKELKQRLIFIP